MIEYRSKMHKVYTHANMPVGSFLWVYKNGLVSDGNSRFYADLMEYYSSLDGEVLALKPDETYGEDWVESQVELLDDATYYSTEAMHKMLALLGSDDAY